MATIADDALNDVSDIQALYSTDLGTGVIINAINMAYRKTIPLAGRLGDCGGAGTQKDIERLLAIHFLTLREPEVVSEEVGDEAKVTFRGEKVGTGLMSSRWGQTALDLDCSGTLASSGLKRVDIEVLSQDDF